MGAETHFQLANKPFTSDSSPFLGRDFTFEISLGYLFEDKSFLSAEEWKILVPQNRDTTQPIEPLEAERLQVVLEKVMTHLYEKQAELPVEVELNMDKMEQENLPTDLIIQGSRCWIQGDSAIFKVNPMVRMVSYPNEPHLVDFWVEVADRLELEGKMYYLHQVTRFTKYHSTLSKLIDLCKEAGKTNEKVYWTLST